MPPGAPSLDGGMTLADEILTIQEIAILLKLADKTVYSMAQGGELPAFKVRGQWQWPKLLEPFLSLIHI